MKPQKPLLERLFNLLLTYVGPQQLVILTLLLGALLSATQGIAAVVRDLDAQPLWYLGTMGVLVGWTLGGSTLTTWASAIWGTLLGLFVVMVRMGHLGNVLWQTLLHGLGLSYQTLRYLAQSLQALAVTLLSRLKIPFLQFTPPFRLSPHPQPFLTALNDLLLDVHVLLVRLQIWLIALLRREVLYDPVAASVAWGLLLWLAALWAGWIIHRRQRPLLALIPLGVLLGGLLSYAGAATTSLLFLMSFGLLLMAIVHHQAREHHWEKIGLDFSEDLGTEIIGLTLALTLVLTLTAAILPTISVREIVSWMEERIETWRERQTRPDLIAESLGVEPLPQPRPVSGRGPLEQVATGGLPRRHLIGSGPELSEQVALIVRTGELRPMPEEALMEAPPNHYWRSLSYDLYTGHGWATSRTETLSYEGGELIRSPDLPAHRLLTQEVEVVDEKKRLLYAAGSLVTVEQPFKVAWRQGPGRDIFGVTAESNTYRVHTLVSTATVEALRAAGTAYPDWVLDRYLQLPDDVPNRVLQLARRLTATELTPYDRAQAIELYLRNTYSYTLNIPSPPSDHDIVDYFLFGLKKGYCDYYATSMVVLARAAGIPARLAVGYITGTYDAINAQYIVTEAEAHAWVEVYFPGYGWIKFEPTSGRPSLWRPTDQLQPEWETADEELPPTEVTSGPTSRLLRVWYLLLPGVLLAPALLLLLATVLDQIWLRLQSPSRAILRLYHRLRRQGRRLHVPLSSGDTPYEFGERFTTHLTSLSTKSRLLGWTEQGTEEVRHLIELYVLQNYTPEMSGQDQRGRALRAWWRLRWRLLALRLWQKLPTGRAPIGEVRLAVDDRQPAKEAGPGT